MLLTNNLVVAIEYDGETYCIDCGAIWFDDKDRVLNSDESDGDFVWGRGMIDQLYPSDKVCDWCKKPVLAVALNFEMVIERNI